MRITCKTNDTLTLDALTEFQGGLKKRDDSDFEKIRKSIEKYGFATPFFVWKRGRVNYVLDGHGRLETLKRMQADGAKIPPLPIVFVDCKSEADAKNLLLRINSTYGKMTAESVMDFIGGMEIDIKEIALPSGTLDIEIPTENNIDSEKLDEIPENAESVCKRGDIWKLGEHRLMCGDSTDGGDVALLMNGEKATMAFNDPPYGMKKESEGVLNDNLNYKDLLEFNKKWIENELFFLCDVGSFYCWGMDEPLMDIYSEIVKPLVAAKKATFRNLITWNKGTGQGQNSEEYRMYAIADEKCIFFMLGTQEYNNNADNYFEGFEPIRQYLEQQKKLCGWDVPQMKKVAGHSDLSRDHWTGKSQWSLIPEYVYKKFQEWANANGINAFEREYKEISQEYEKIKKEYYKAKREFYNTRGYFDNTHDNMNNVWDFKRSSKTERKLTGGHATPKPIALCSRAIKSSSRVGDIVIDLFGGSGSTLIACEQLKRKCYTMELDEHYCDVIIKRWETLTGGKAEKAS